MQNHNSTIDSATVARLDHDEFRRAATERTERLHAELATLHDERSCVYGIDIETVKSWTEAKREETLRQLRSAVSRADILIREAQDERTKLWERSDAPPAERILPQFIHQKHIQQDLAAYEDVYYYVKSQQGSGA
jgi:hypothetical protein